MRLSVCAPVDGQFVTLLTGSALTQSSVSKTPSKLSTYRKPFGITPPPGSAQVRSRVSLPYPTAKPASFFQLTAQLATLTDQDVSIVVQMGDIGSGSFERVPDAIPLDQAAALAASAQLARYSVSPEEYRLLRSRVNRDYLEPIKVAGVKVAGLERVNPEYVEQAINATQTGAAEICWWGAT
jgi:hypothetical protein